MRLPLAILIASAVPAFAQELPSGTYALQVDGGIRIGGSGCAGGVTGLLAGEAPDAWEISSPESGAVRTEVTADDPEHRSQLAMALSMSLPGARLDMVLGGPQPLLMELVRALAHEAARADHEADCEPSMLVGQISG